MHYVIETVASGRLEFRGQPMRTKYEASRYLDTFIARGKNAEVHSFANNVLAECYVAEHNAPIEARLFPAKRTSPPASQPGQRTTMTTIQIGNRHHRVNTSLAVGETFRLIGRDVPFRAASVYRCPMAGAMVRGISTCGQFGTTARVVDTCEV